MVPRRAQVLAMVVSGALGAGVAVACGDSAASRSNEQDERIVPGATPATTITNPTQLTPTGETQPEVTQPTREPGQGEEALPQVEGGGESQDGGESEGG